MLTTTLWRLVSERSVRNDISKLRLLLIGANSWGKGGIIFLCFHEEKGDQNSIAGSTYIFMICNDIKAVNPVDQTCLNQMIF